MHLLAQGTSNCYQDGLELVVGGLGNPRETLQHMGGLTEAEKLRCPCGGGKFAGIMEDLWRSKVTRYQGSCFLALDCFSTRV